MNTNLNKKLKNYALLAVTGSLLLNTGCKKDEDEKEKETIVDNPNVEYIDIADIVVDGILKKGASAKIDLNSDGNDDFIIETNYYNTIGRLTKYTSISGKNYNGSVATRRIDSPLFPGYAYFDLLTEIPIGQSIKGQNFVEPDGYSSIDVSFSGAKVISEGLQGKGDKYIGVKFKIGVADHFGWLKVNVDANAAKITIKEWAYNKVPNESLNAGDR